MIYFIQEIEKRGLFLHRTRRADVAQRRTRVDATWHTRSRGSAMRTHTSSSMALMWRGCVAGPRESTRTQDG